jgi:hypothetical protein
VSGSGLSALAESLEATLVRARNPDGGWPYVAGRQSRLEPTTLALLALRASGHRIDITTVAGWPRRSGLLLDARGGEVNLAWHAQAALIAQSFDDSAVAASLVTALVDVKGVALPPSPALKQDDRLQGWPWSLGTFSWVEPTAWAIMAVRRWHRVRPTLDAASRIFEAERLLLDRAIAAGGWNYGNAALFGRDLRPHMPTTALALVALEPIRDHPVVVRGRALLTRRRTAEMSGLPLSLAQIAFGRFGERYPDVESALERVWNQTQFFGNLATLALALYACRGHADGYDAFAS